MIKTEQLSEEKYKTTVFVKDSEHQFDELVSYYKTKDGKYALYGTVLDMFTENDPDAIEIALSRNYNEDGFIIDIYHFGPICF